MSYTIEIKPKLELKENFKEVTRRVIILTKNEMIRNLKINTPVDTGRARGSWFMSSYDIDKVTIKSSAKYMSFLDKGTGIYGPKRRQITPKKGKYLVFKYKGNTVFAQSVKGIKPHKIIDKSIEKTEKRIPGFAKMATNGL